MINTTLEGGPPTRNVKLLDMPGMKDTKGKATDLSSITMLQ